jgi:SPP1 gp7 family putative phage head morphogenesis protein
MPNKFATHAASERRMAIELRKVARIVAGIIKPHIDGHQLVNASKMKEALLAYSEIIEPWARRMVAGILETTAKVNAKAFSEAGAKTIGASLRVMASETAIGGVVKLIQNRQVDLIKRLPLEAGLRAQDLALKAAMDGSRASEVAQALANTEGVTLSRATLIARTEIAKANAAITQARAEYVGATHYIWQTAEDGDVRESHAEMQGQIFRFDSAPTLSDGETHGPGEIYNCRCFAEPVIE